MPWIASSVVVLAVAAVAAVAVWAAMSGTPQTMPDLPTVHVDTYDVNTGIDPLSVDDVLGRGTANVESDLKRFVLEGN